MTITTFDQTKNLSYGTVLTAPSPAQTGTTLVLNSGQGARFPNPVSGEYNCTVWPAGEIPTSVNAEIVRVTALSTDTFTITRIQESSVARVIIPGDQFALTYTKLKEDSIIAAVNALETNHDPDTAAVLTDTIGEKNTGSGITVDGLLIKDGIIPATGLTITKTATIDLALTNGAVSGLSNTSLQARSTGTPATCSVNYILFTLDITSLSIPATAKLLSWEFWIAGAGDSGGDAASRCFANTITYASVGLYCQIAGNSSGFPNTTNSHVQGYVVYAI